MYIHTYTYTDLSVKCIRIPDEVRCPSGLADERPQDQGVYRGQELGLGIVRRHLQGIEFAAD